jgi:hypothetical protein
MIVQFLKLLVILALLVILCACGVRDGVRDAQPHDLRGIVRYVYLLATTDQDYNTMMLRERYAADKRRERELSEQRAACPHGDVTINMVIG